MLCLAATAGLLFASVSTLDFVAHLDRQVHELHCSFVPGLAAPSEGAEGCKLTLMSPYSSVLRRSQWGGIPISLPAMAVFAFLLFRAVDLFGRPARQRRAAASVLLAATIIPAVASLAMGWIAFTELDAACKLCIGIYGSSAVALLAAGWVRALTPDITDEPGDAGAEPPASTGTLWLFGAAQLGAFVAVPTLAYVAIVPDFSRFIGECGRLPSVDDPYGVLVPLDDRAAGTPTVEVLDPLCPACKGFEERLEASGLAERLHRVALLFPLDETCNWMVSKSLHPGACAVSEAVLCARRHGLAPTEVIDWAFEHQAEIMAAEKRTPGSAAQLVADRFGTLKACLGSAEVASDLNKSLRWAVAHELPVMTPQLYVGGIKLCDEDTDLGMEWALSQVLERQAAGTLPSVGLTTPAAAPSPVAADDPHPSSTRPKASAKRSKPRPTPSRTAPDPAPKAPTEKPAPEKPAPEQPDDTPPEPAPRLPSIEEIPPPAPEPDPSPEEQSP